jgi:hypothetical protein
VIVKLAALPHVKMEEAVYVVEIVLALRTGRDHLIAPVRHELQVHVIRPTLWEHMIV